MKRSLVFAVFLMLTAATFAWAAAIQLPRTGQTTCYDSGGTAIDCWGTGQDGEYEAGAAWPSERFAVYGDCVTDNLTGLMWPKAAQNTASSWTNALDYANNLTLCGYSDWRLPNVNELESLLNSERASSADWLNSQGFSGVQSVNYYWTSSVSNYDGRAWIRQLAKGDLRTGTKLNTNYVWPVRDAQ